MTNSAPSAPASKKKTSALEAILERKSRPLRYEVQQKEKQPQSRWRYLLKVEEADASELLDEIVAEFAKVVSLPGFRPGKAPVKMVRGRFEENARGELINRIVPRLLEQVAENEGHQVIGQAILLRQESSREKGTIIEIAFEVKPNLTITDDLLDGIEVEVPRPIVDDEVADWGMEQLRIRQATYKAGDENTTWNHGDALVYDCVVEDQDGDVVEELSVEETYTNEVDRRLPASIVDMLVGKKQGDVVIGTHVLRQNQAVEVPGVEELVLRYKVTIKEVKPRVLPALDEAFVKDVNPELNTVEELREQQRKEAEQSFAESARREALSAIFEKLRERLDFEIPRGLVRENMNRQIMDVERRLNSHKLSLNQTDPSFQQAFMERVEKNAEQNVRDMFINDALAKHFSIAATEEQINEALEKLAKAANRKPMAVRAALEKNKEWAGFVDGLRDRAVADFVLGKVKVNYKDQKMKRNERGALVPAVAE